MDFRIGRMAAETRDGRLWLINYVRRFLSIDPTGWMRWTLEQRQKLDLRQRGQHPSPGKRPPNSVALGETARVASGESG